MAQELERECPSCGETRTFSLAASTTLHLGTKTKWRCPECNHAFVRIGEDIFSDQPA
jgi:transposase-like protein